MQLSGKVALVTGASRGIGRAIALALAEAGADVMLTFAQQEQQAHQVAAEITGFGRRCRCLRYDAHDPSTADALVAATVRHLGHIDVLVNNAAVYRPESLLQCNPDALEALLRVNTVAPAYLMMQVIRHMLDEGTQGAILNILSAAAKRPRRGLGGYAASKAALGALTEAAAAEFGEHGIRVNAIAPGLIATDMNRFVRDDHPDQWQALVDRIPLGRAGVAADVAGAAVFLASDASRFVTGVTLAVDGGRLTL